MGERHRDFEKIEELERKTENIDITFSQDMNEYDGRVSFQEKLRLLYGIIENHAFISIDIVWVRIQFRASYEGISYRVIFGSTEPTAWKEI